MLEVEDILSDTESLHSAEGNPTQPSNKRSHTDSTASDKSTTPAKSQVKKAAVVKLQRGDDIDCAGKCVPDGFLFHVVGIEEPERPSQKVRLLVKPGAPPSWKPTNIGFFIGRHVAKHLPEIQQYSCSMTASDRCKLKVQSSKTDAYVTKVRTCVPGKGPHVWPAYNVAFRPCAASIALMMNASRRGSAPLLSELYSCAVSVGESHIVPLSNYLRSEGRDFALLQKLEQESDFVLDRFIGSDHADPAVATMRDTASGVSSAGIVIELDSGIASPLLLTMHCLVLDRDVSCAPHGPVSLIDSIPPVMRLDGMPDAATLRRWVEITLRRCQQFHEPILSWCVSSIQFGRRAHVYRTLVDLIMSEVRTLRDRPFHDLWLEWVFRVVSLPFSAIILKRREVAMYYADFPLADMPAVGKAHERPVVALHSLAANNMFHIAAVLCGSISSKTLSGQGSHNVRCCQSCRHLHTPRQDILTCIRMYQCCSVLASAVFYNPQQLKQVLFLATQFSK